MDHLAPEMPCLFLQNCAGKDYTCDSCFNPATHVTFFGLSQFGLDEYDIKVPLGTIDSGAVKTKYKTATCRDCLMDDRWKGDYCFLYPSGNDCCCNGEIYNIIKDEFPIWMLTSFPSTLKIRQIKKQEK